MNEVVRHLRPAVSGEWVLRHIEGQGWLDGPGYRVEHVLELALNALGDAKRPVGNVLHGTVLGHPLHPVLTDIPVGAWTAGLVLDTAGDLVPATQQSGYREAARQCVAVGLVGAGAAALAGLADWQYTQDDARRVGMVHASANILAVSCYTASLVWRRRGSYGLGRRAAIAGYALVMASGYLGGSLVARYRVGVDHADRRLRPRQFTTVLAEDQLVERQPVTVDADGMSILLIRSAGKIYALGQQCSHLGGPLERGWLIGETVVCPWHGSAFALATGEVCRGPATCPQPSFETRVRDGEIQVRCRPGSPGASPGSVVAAEQRDDDAGH